MVLHSRQKNNMSQAAGLLDGDQIFSTPCTILLDHVNSMQEQNLALIADRGFNLPLPGPKKLIFPCPESEFNEALEGAYKFLQPSTFLAKRKKNASSYKISKKAKELLRVADLYFNSNFTFAEIGRKLGISRQKIKYNVKMIRKHSKGIEDKRKTRAKITQEHKKFLSAYLSVGKNQTNTLKEIRNAMIKNFSLPPNYVSLKTLHSTLWRLGITRKKTVKIDPEKNESETIQQRRLVSRILVECYRRKHNLIYIDEVAFASNSRSNYGYSKKGSKVKVSGHLRDKHLSVIAAMNSQRILAWTIFDGSIKSVDFMGFISGLAIRLREDYNILSPVFFFDNAPTHKSKIIQEKLSKYVAFVFNARYTPELNPIELAFNKVKSHFRKLMDQSEGSILIKICESFRSITFRDVKGFIKRHLQNIKDAFNKEEF
jgi:transposase